MSSLTAQVAVGQEDRYHGGINPTHILSLRENSRASWLLQPTWRTPNGSPLRDPDGALLDQGLPTWTLEEILWIPGSPEHILEDMVVMVALHVLSDPPSLDIADARADELFDADLVELGKQLRPEVRTELVHRSREIDLNYKLAISILGGSSLNAQLPQLADYPMQLEISTPSYSRLRTGMASSGPVEERGDLRAVPSAWAGAGGPEGHRYGDVNIW